MSNLMRRIGIENCFSFTMVKLPQYRTCAIAITIAILSSLILTPEYPFAQTPQPTQPAPKSKEPPVAKEDGVEVPDQENVVKDAKPDSMPDQNTQEKPEITPDVKQESAQEKVNFPPIMRDLSKLPFPVRRMRELILEAALSGDIENLRPLVGFGEDVTMLSLGGIEEDPLGFLKSLAGDDHGHEILAILVEVLESGYVHLDKGTEQELYVWPYFFAWPLDKLTPRQRVELYRLVTHGDYQDMESFGAYIFYRLGISPRGRWRFFVAGD